VHGGVGTELKRIFSWFGQYRTEQCHCVKYADMMDENGIEWCEKCKRTIRSWILQEAKNRGPVTEMLASMALGTMIDLAIRNAKLMEQKTCDGQ